MRSSERRRQLIPNRPRTPSSYCHEQHCWIWTTEFLMSALKLCPDIAEGILRVHTRRVRA